MIISEKINSNHNAINEGTIMKNARIFAENCIVSNDTRVTGLNNNDTIIGGSGSGKTGGYVVHSLTSDSESSFVVVDTKGQLFKLMTPLFKERGYEIAVVDFVNPKKSYGYDPIKAIRKNYDGSYNQQDIMSITNILVPFADPQDSFWISAARNVVSCAISYVLENFDKADKNFWSVFKVCKRIISDADTSERAVPFLEIYATDNPKSFCIQKYNGFKGIIASEKTWGSIGLFLNHMERFEFSEIKSMFTKKKYLDFTSLGKKKTIVFLNVSDTDHSLDDLVNIFYTQLFQKLCRAADSNPDGRLKVPLRIFLDDFAANVRIEDFDKLISVIRSRDIYVSIMLQSLTQLESLYKPSQASTIVSNCDHILYLGGNDYHTAEFLAARMCMTPEKVLSLPNDEVLFVEKGKLGEKFKRLKPYGCLDLKN